MVVRYGKKVKSGPAAGEVVVQLNGKREEITVDPLADERFREWML